MSSTFDFERFVALGFSVVTYSDSFGRAITECTYLRGDTQFKLKKTGDSNNVMGVRSSISSADEWENHAVDEDEALRWFHRIFNANLQNAS